MTDIKRIHSKIIQKILNTNLHQTFVNFSIKNKKKEDIGLLYSFIDKNGKSDFITSFNSKDYPTTRRFNSLPKSLISTNGASILRSDGCTGKLLKMVRFKKNFPKNKLTSNSSWDDISTDEVDLITMDHKYLEKLNIWPMNGNNTQYIKFYGEKKNKEFMNGNVAPEILSIICKLPCAHCNSNYNIQCDHKNSIWRYNDHRLGVIENQTLSMFQPLCGKCNCIKRNIDIDTVIKEKRQGPPINSGWTSNFTEGDETFDIKDPYWYKGTYWGDIVAWRQCFVLKK